MGPTLIKGRGRSRLGPRRKSNAGSTNLSQSYGELWGKYYLSECPALGQNAWAFVLLHLRCGLSWGRPDLGRGGPLQPRLTLKELGAGCSLLTPLPAAGQQVLPSSGSRWHISISITDPKACNSAFLPLFHLPCITEDHSLGNPPGTDRLDASPSSPFCRQQK